MQQLKQRNIGSDLQFLIPLVLFVTVLVINLLHHELWRDELQAWMMAKWSDSIAHLFENLTFERHPRLWHILLFLITRFTDNPIFMQILHAVFAAGSAYLILRFSPFRIWQRITIIFGYYFVYEYATISRNYAPGIFFALLFCTLYSKKNKNFLMLSLALFLLSQTNAFGNIISLSLTIYMILDSLLKNHFVFKWPRWNVIIGYIIIATGILISVRHSQSPDISLNNNIYDFVPIRFATTIDNFYEALAPIPPLHINFWNENMLDRMLFKLPLALLIVTVVLLYLSRKPQILFLYVTGAGAMVLIMYFFHTYKFLRHMGHLYILLIICLWLGNGLSEWTPKKQFLRALLQKSAKLGSALVAGLLIANFAGGIIASGLEWKYPFSAGEITAHYIQEHNLDKYYMIGSWEEAASTVVGYLGAQAYYPQREYIGSFIIYRNVDTSFDKHSTIEIAKKKSRQLEQDILLILNFRAESNDPHLQFLEEFTQSVVADETFYLYMYKHP